MKIKCIAVDDEPLALELLSKFIDQTSFLSLEGKFDNAIEALAFINNHEVQLIFLDIQMPDLSGMELARILAGKSQDKRPKIIFTTAYNQFAIEGYKVDALDYLLKPFSYEEFLRASTKAFEYLEANRKNDFGQKEGKENLFPDYIFVKAEYQLVKVILKNITYVEGYKDYVKIHLSDKTSPILSLTSMKNMEEMLPSSKFMRIHRSFIINLDHIDAIAKNAVTIDNFQINVGENYKEQFGEFLSRWTG